MAMEYDFSHVSNMKMIFIWFNKRKPGNKKAYFLLFLNRFIFTLPRRYPSFTMDVNSILYCVHVHNLNL